MLLVQLCPAVELGKLKVLYVGDARSARAADSKAFLGTNVARVEVAGRMGFDPAMAAPSSSSTVNPYSRCKWSRIPGSTVPDHVPIIKPSSGLKPSVVATATPPRTAAAEQPPPRWQVMTRNSDSGRLSSSAVRAAQ